MANFAPPHPRYLHVYKLEAPKPFQFWLLAPLCENIKSSTKLLLHNILHCLSGQPSHGHRFIHYYVQPPDLHAETSLAQGEEWNR